MSREIESGALGLDQLRRAYPVVGREAADFAVDEPTDDPDWAGEGYGAIRARFIESIGRVHG